MKKGPIFLVFLKENFIFQSSIFNYSKLWTVNMLKAINYFQTCQNLFKYWFTLLHFALGDPEGILKVWSPSAKVVILLTSRRFFQKKNERIHLFLPKSTMSNSFVHFLEEFKDYVSYQKVLWKLTIAFSARIDYH